MIRLNPADETDLRYLKEIEMQSHVGDFIDATTIAQHIDRFHREDTIYLNIVNNDDAILGYFILVEESENRIEFARIVVDQNHRGVGQTAIKLMEQYCIENLQAKTIWLDVYEDNPVGIHVYEKLGYLRTSTADVNGRKLHFYEKYVINH